MPYLQRRFSSLLDDLRTGRLVITSLPEDLFNEICEIKLDDAGNPQIEGTSDRLRGFVRAYYLATTSSEQRDSHVDTADEDGRARGPVSIEWLKRRLDELYSLHRKMFFAYFRMLPEDYFRGAPNENDAFNRYRAVLLKGKTPKPDPEEVNEAESRLLKFYENHSLELLQTSGRMPLGTRSVIGGQQPFTEPGMKATLEACLLSDTVFLPDPVSRYYELGGPQGDRYGRIEKLRELSRLLQVWPVVFCDNAGLPLFIFPSMERVFDTYDKEWQDEQELILMHIFRDILQIKIDDLSEIFDYVTSHAAAEPRLKDARIFVPPGGDGAVCGGEAMSAIRDSYRDTRNNEWLKLYGSDAAMLAMYLCERINPSFHHSKNAEAIRGDMVSQLPSHHFYMTLMQSIVQEGYVESNVLASHAAGARHGSAIEWFPALTVEETITLRRDPEHNEFRNRVSAIFMEVRSAGVSGDELSSAVLRRIDEAYRLEKTRIERKYEGKHLATAIKGAGVGFLAALAVGLLGGGNLAAAITGSLTIGGMYAADKVEGSRETRTLEKSLLGILGRRR
jgi:hypothetical protein